MGSDASLGRLLQAPRSKGKIHTIVHLNRSRMASVLVVILSRSPILSDKGHREGKSSALSSLRHRVGKGILAGEGVDDCYPFASARHSSGTWRLFDWLCWVAVAMSAGWKMTAAASVVSSESAINLPMLEVPG
jgi:hypothetical protein